MQLIASLAIAAAMAVSAHAAATITSLVINTPADATQCVPTVFTFSGGVAPFTLLFSPLPGSLQRSQAVHSILEDGNVIESFSGLTGPSFVWSTNVPGGQSISVEIADASATAFTAPFVVLPSDDSSCL
ncbi:hypothetical protein L226DRAFT_570040 [Lentinus tigrinus ALCF2SS1-7]|uniref:Uncharacterized protein n=1 Tax=Lentinus tigrinus ALCF2SS1-6 TaxID=1328759 RepID=A0A5C2SGU9_9APHY|nr:hypothetical protein L227DRAFT_611087 [Lentinus tigrinus ALCF2SS1-6]RPD75796.1 hypothetical protein L226DRAFT_570040 [Lentinus tigrinus ALCF2SS1-7]